VTVSVGMSTSPLSRSSTSTKYTIPVTRSLRDAPCLSETCLLERDSQTYSVCTLRPLADIFALVRSQDNPQLFNIEYVNGHVRTYTATDR
jgi:DnaJ family protein C protein 13